MMRLLLFVVHGLTPFMVAQWRSDTAVATQVSGQRLLVPYGLNEVRNKAMINAMAD